MPWRLFARSRRVHSVWRAKRYRAGSKQDQRVDETGSEPHAKESAETALRGDPGWDAGDARRAGEGTRGRFVSMQKTISGLSLRRCYANPMRANRDTVHICGRWCRSLTLAPEIGNPTRTVRALERTLSRLDRDRRSARTTCRG